MASGSSCPLDAESAAQDKRRLKAKEKKRMQKEKRRVLLARAEADRKPSSAASVRSLSHEPLLARHAWTWKLLEGLAAEHEAMGLPNPLYAGGEDDDVKCDEDDDAEYDEERPYDIEGDGPITSIDERLC